MNERPETIWIATGPVLEKARFIRQKVYPALFSSQVKALINIIGASLWIEEKDGTDGEPRQGERIPARYTDVVLYHVRSGKVIHKEDRLAGQGIQDGDVLVVLRSDTESMGRAAAVVREMEVFPTSVPGDIPGDVTSIPATQLLKILGKDH